MQKINFDVDFLFQCPKKNVKLADDTWFDKVPVGRDPLNDTMKNLSKNAALSKMYTNHSIRATVVTNLDQAGYKAHHIMATTGHKSESSIKNYSRMCPSNKRREMNDTLAGKLSNNMNTPGPSKKIKNEPTSTVTAPEEPNFDLGIANFETIDQRDLDEIFNGDNLIELKEILDLVTQIEKENSQVVPETAVPETRDENQQIAKQPQAKNNTVNISNVAHVNCQPLIPHMLFPHSNVTINYHIHQ